MEIKNTKNSEKLLLSVDAWKLLETERCELIQIEIKPGEIIEKHRNPFNVIFYVTEGSGVIEIENRKIHLEMGDSISINQNLLRSWENNSKGRLTLLVIKTV